ncbi:MAG: polysaccharide deacetylase family protein [Actinomycetota bacterium]
MSSRDLAVSLLRSGPVTMLSRLVTRGRLRILAYHGVPDPDLFAAQMEYLARKFTPVGEAAVADAIHRGAKLPSGAAWVTFDDGDPSVVVNGLPTLERLGIPATMFVCPGLIESGMPFWWRVTEWASEHMPDRAAAVAPTAEELTEHCKLLSDGRRRLIVDQMLEHMQQPRPEDWRQLSSAELDAWTDAGMALGNHTWDHPCLDQCNETVQRDQVRDAHEWLTDHLGHPPISFAYPNGNFSPIVDTEVARLGYDLGVLYDNKLTPLDSEPLQLSRVMLEADQPAKRLVGVLSGAQPVARAIRESIRSDAPV